MAVFKVPRITTAQRMTLTLEVAEIVYDTDLKIYFGGDGVTLGGFAIGSGLNIASEITEYVTLSPSDVLAKSVTLLSTPVTPENVLLTPAGGIQQLYGVDYIVSGNVVTWRNRQLDGYLEASDSVIISYSTASQGRTERLVLTAGNILTKSAILQLSPTNPQGVSLVPVGGIDQIYGFDFKITGDVLSWGGLGLDGFLEPGDELVVSY